MSCANGNVAEIIADAIAAAVAVVATVVATGGNASQTQAHIDPAPGVTALLDLA